ncbi:SDR family NAD(P)-dependent oxidoreductase [Streptomyces sp. KL116D]|uniref:SDR family NAD(P)-dependent oxidoreductase n=1 Tax=Streptomyces sp. KL116D TaxID=3045152 RepID=UPI0035579B52
MGVDFTGRVAVITGAGNGLGAAYAKKLAALGAAVVVNDLGSRVDGTADGSNPAENVAADIRVAGGRAVANNDSVATPDGGKAIIDTAVKEFGRLDIVIHNAGNRRNKPIEEITPEDLDSVLAVHLKGAMYVAQPAFGVMKEQGYGRLLFTGSSAGLFGNAGQLTYAAAKAGVLGLSHSLAIEGAAHGIKANVLLPMAGTPRALSGMSAQATAAIGGEQTSSNSDTDLVGSLVVYLVSEECALSHEIMASAGGRYYSAFIGTTEGWRRAGDAVPSPDDVAAHLDIIRSRDGYQVPSSLGDDVAASMGGGVAPQSTRTPVEAAAGYFKAVLSQDVDALHSLFTPDAVIDVPGSKVTGNDAIADFYREVFAQSTPQPTPGPLLAQGNRVSVQIALHRGGKDYRMADFFTVTPEGRISEMVAYQAD